MKRFLFPSLIACLTSVALLSCYKKGDHESRGTQYVTIDTTIASGSLYQLDLKQYGDADDVATIKTQAVTYTTSNLVNSGTGFSPVYNFSALADPKNGPLTEPVVIAVTEGNHGQRCPNHDSTLITINFKVQ